MSIKLFHFDLNLKKVTFVNRKNRFVVEVSNKEQCLCHLHDPGKLEEILIPGRELYVFSKNEGLKCEVLYSVINKEKVLINSKFHSLIAENLIKKSLFSDVSKIKREITVGKSRIDFLVIRGNKELYLEVKGCTLVENNVAYFPDAVTARGERHVRELMQLKKEGKDAAVLFLVLRDAKYFAPNWKTDPKFSRTLREAHESGVEIYPYKLTFDGKTIRSDSIIKLIL